MFLARDAGFEVVGEAEMGSRRCGWLGASPGRVLMDLVMRLWTVSPHEVIRREVPSCRSWP